MPSRNVQFAPGGRNNRRRPRRSVREESDDRGFNGSCWPDFTWKNGDVPALPGRCCFPTDTFDHRCLKRRCPESLPLPRHRSHKYVKRLRFELEQPELSEVRNCVSGFSHELAVPLSKLVLFFNAAFCRRDQRYVVGCKPTALTAFFWQSTRF